MPICENKFWLENYPDLFCEIDIIPLTKMSLSRQLNALTRLLFLITLIIAPFTGLQSVYFFIAGIVFIIILFYSLRNMDCREKYQPCTFKSTNRTHIKNERTPGLQIEYYQPQCGKTVKKCVKNTQNPVRAVLNYTDVNPGPDFFSPNQALVGKPSARTMVPPILVPPPFSSEWKENSLVVRPGINTGTNQDLSSSGYLVSNEGSNCTDEIGQKYCCGKDISMELVRSTYTPVRDIVEGFEIEKTIKKPDVTGLYSDYEYPYKPYGNCGKKTEKKIEISDAIYSGDVLITDGYFPEQIIDDNLPSNINFGLCPKDSEFKQYNKQLYTSTLQPGVYTRNQIEEPISSNIGISFTQQFEPVTCEKNCNGVTFIGHDPNVMEIPYEKPEELLPYERQTHLADIYDPRFTGYGTSYRSYVEPVTGQVRFYYDDIDAYKRPNYLCRSKVDFIPSSLTTQPIPNQEYFNKQNRYSRSIANEAFMDDTIAFRTDIQERLMRKANANLAQARKFPKHTRSIARGGMSNPRCR